MNKKLKINSSFLDNIVDILPKESYDDYDIIIGIEEHDNEFVVNTDVRIEIIDKEK